MKEDDDMSRIQQQETEAIDRALDWIEQLKDGRGNSEAFFDWLADSPRHVEVLLQATTLERRLVAIPPEEWTNLERTGSNPISTEEPSNVVALQSSTPPSSAAHGNRGRKIWMTAVAASATIIAIGTWQLFTRTSDGQEFTTTVGEQRAIQLADGSVVNLNTASHLQVRMSAQSRDLRLIEGEALFKVQRDAVRPFRVQVRDAVIQAVGTQFNVQSRARGTTVSVLEGKVRVIPQDTAPPISLSAGEQADVEAGGKVKRRVAAADPARVTAWQQRRLIFDEETLANITTEFNRYNRRHFRVEDADAARRRFSGIFDADDPESLAQLLARDTGLSVEREAGGILIRAR